MNSRLALLYAVIGVCLLLSISFFITLHEIWLVVLAALVSILFIGSGFIVKSRARRKQA